MTETVEYALVVMVSTLFVAGSVMTYDSFSSFEAGLQFRAEFRAISTAASAALVNGTSTAELSLPASTISCQSGTLTFNTGLMTDSLSFPVPCDFSVRTPQGSHLLQFAVRSSGLTLAVS